MSQETLLDFVAATAAQFGIPGVAVGVWADGRAEYACHGVTSIDNPLPVDRDTLYVLGSVTKTYTATALMRLVAQGQVELDAPVRRYVPELRLADEQAAAEITVLNLLNHTAGLDWRMIVDTGEGDDALAAYVAKLAELKLIAPPGARASYSQAGYNLAGRIIEKVTGLTYERAIASLVLEPLGLSHSFFARDDVMTRRFAVGHNPGDDGTLSVARLWRCWRGDNPGGGLASSVADQIRWARFHLGDGHAESGVRVLPAETAASDEGANGRIAGQHARRRHRYLAGSCAMWTVSAPSGTAGRRTASSPKLLIVPERASPSSRCPMPARTASLSTRPSSIGRWRPTLVWWTGIRNRSPLTRSGPGRSSEDTRQDAQTLAIRTDGAG